MTITSGLGQQFYVDGYDLSSATGSATRIGKSQATFDKPAISDSGMRRIPGLRDGTIDFTTYFDDTAILPVLSTLTTSDRYATWLFGTTLGDVSASVVAKQIGYDPTRDQSGDINFTTSMPGNAYGLEWGRAMTAGQRSDTTATNGTGYDWGAGTTFGMQAYLQVFSFTGTDVTIKLQESQDDDMGDAYADVLNFASVTAAPQAQRVTVTGTVEQWLRVVTSTTGGFSECTFAVAVTRNSTAAAAI